jgi:PAS domain S-box-containing protein
MMNAARDILFGLLAVRSQMIVSDQLIEACALWPAQQDIPLAEVLAKRGWIKPSDREQLDQLVASALCRSGSDCDSKTSLPVDPSCAGGESSTPTTQVTEFMSAASDQTQPCGGRMEAGVGFHPRAHERYTRIRLHATGGTGCIWLARDNFLGRDIALKELRPDQADNPAIRSRFLKEAQITGQLEHPGIVPVYELTLQSRERPLFYTMRFIKGRTLSEAARDFHAKRRSGQFSAIDWSVLLNAFVAVCNTVAYAHSRGVLHRDLKGQNIVLGDFGEFEVLDWGLAKLVGQAEGESSEDTVLLDVAESNDDLLTVAGQVIGTPGYMAPEQASGQLGQIDRRTDVYGLGAILYEILTGQPPFAGRGAREVLRRVREEEPTPPRSLWTEVPSTLEEVCLRALHKKPAERFASPSELAQQVQQWQEVERKQAEDALRASESLYHSLVETIPMNVWRKDASGRFTFGNRGFCTTSKRSLAELIGKTDYDILPADYAEKYRRDDAWVLAIGETLETTEEHLTGAGDKLDVRVVKLPIYDGQGHIVGTQGMFWDVSDRTRLEQALAETTAELNRLKQQLQKATEGRSGDARTFERGDASPGEASNG